MSTQGRLQSLVDRRLPESQCGFRGGGRRCTDICGEKISREGLLFLLTSRRRTTLHVPCLGALWLVMRKLGVPEVLIVRCN